MALEGEEISGKWAQRGVYFLVMGIGAFFAYFNELRGWVRAPEYPRLSDFLFDRLDPYIQPYLPGIVLVLGGLFLLASIYSFYRFANANPSGGSAA